MVLLTMTPSIVEALGKLDAPKPTQQSETADSDEPTESSHILTEEPSLDNPEVGKPIYHGQIIQLWQQLRAQSESHPLEQLLRGANIYIPPSPPKPEPVS